MDARLEAIEKEFVARWFEFHPGAAFFAGIHDHDREIGDVSRPAIEGFAAELERFRARASALTGLGPADELERDVLLAKLDGARFEYLELHPWRSDPSFYGDALASQLNGLAIFNYAPAEERLLAAIAKLRHVPAFLAAARANLEPAPPILVHYGERAASGALALVERDLPRALAQGAPPALVRRLDAARDEAARALGAFLVWLKDGLPRAPVRAYSLGHDRYEGWLFACERVVTPLDRLEKWATGAIAEHRDALAREAARIDPAAPPREVVERITARHPRTGEVVAAARRIADEVYDWVRARRLVSFPSEARVRIAATPEFMRWSFGSMWTPGPYEKAPVRATFYATDADPAWPAERQEEHLTAFSYRGLENLAIHEAYPGHYVQALHQHRTASPLRRVFWWGVFGEGWAHYCEQMAIEEGFALGAAEARVVQLQEALVRLCRFVNGIRLHGDDGWDLEHGTRLFMDEAWLTAAVARAECERGTFDPFYLRYTLGKKEILELREEVRRDLGPRFELGAFHDALLAQGSAPMALMRKLARHALGLPVG